MKSPIKYKYNACSIVKIKKNWNHELLKQTKAPLDLVSTDIYRQFLTSKYWDERYFLKVINNYTYCSVIFIEKTRLDCAEQIFKWKKRAEIQTNKRLKAIYINNASELESRALK
jgi:hypothetical protein